MQRLHIYRSAALLCALTLSAAGLTSLAQDQATSYSLDDLPAILNSTCRGYRLDATDAQGNNLTYTATPDGRVRMVKSNKDEYRVEVLGGGSVTIALSGAATQRQFTCVAAAQKRDDNYIDSDKLPRKATVGQKLALPNPFNSSDYEWMADSYKWSVSDETVAEIVEGGDNGESQYQDQETGAYVCRVLFKKPGQVKLQLLDVHNDNEVLVEQAVEVSMYVPCYGCCSSDYWSAHPTTATVFDLSARYVGLGKYVELSWKDNGEAIDDNFHLSAGRHTLTASDQWGNVAEAGLSIDVAAGGYPSLDELEGPFSEGGYDYMTSSDASGELTYTSSEPSKVAIDHKEGAPYVGIRFMGSGTATVSASRGDGTKVSTRTIEVWPSAPGAVALAKIPGRVLVGESVSLNEMSRDSNGNTLQVSARQEGETTDKDLGSSARFTTPGKLTLTAKRGDGTVAATRQLTVVDRAQSGEELEVKVGDIASLPAATAGDTHQWRLLNSQAQLSGAYITFTKAGTVVAVDLANADARGITKYTRIYNVTASAAMPAVPRKALTVGEWMNLSQSGQCTWSLKEENGVLEVSSQADWNWANVYAKKPGRATLVYSDGEGNKLGEADIVVNAAGAELLPAVELPATVAFGTRIRYRNTQNFYYSSDTNAGASFKSEYETVEGESYNVMVFDQPGEVYVVGHCYGQEVSRQKVAVSMPTSLDMSVVPATPTLYDELTLPDLAPTGERIDWKATPEEAAHATASNRLTLLKTGQVTLQGYIGDAPYAAATKTLTVQRPDMGINMARSQTTGRNNGTLPNAYNGHRLTWTVSSPAMAIVPSRYDWRTDCDVVFRAPGQVTATASDDLGNKLCELEFDVKAYAADLNKWRGPYHVGDEAPRPRITGLTPAYAPAEAVGHRRFVKPGLVTLNLYDDFGNECGSAKYTVLPAPALAELPTTATVGLTIQAAAQGSNGPLTYTAEPADGFEAVDAGAYVNLRFTKPGSYSLTAADGSSSTQANVTATLDKVDWQLVPDVVEAGEYCPLPESTLGGQTVRYAYPDAGDRLKSVWRANFKLSEAGGSLDVEAYDPCGNKLGEKTVRCVADDDEFLPDQLPATVHVGETFELPGYTKKGRQVNVDFVGQSYDWDEQKCSQLYNNSDKLTLIAKREGQVVVELSYYDAGNERHSTCRLLTIAPPQPASLDKVATTWYVGQQLPLPLTQGAQELSWTTSDARVASLFNLGDAMLVTMQAPGTVTLSHGAANVTPASVTLTVKQDEVLWADAPSTPVVGVEYPLPLRSKSGETVDYSQEGIGIAIDVKGRQTWIAQRVGEVSLTPQIAHYDAAQQETTIVRLSRRAWTAVAETVDLSTVAASAKVGDLASLPLRGSHGVELRWTSEPAVTIAQGSVRYTKPGSFAFTAKDDFGNTVATKTVTVESRLVAVADIPSRATVGDCLQLSRQLEGQAVTWSASPAEAVSLNTSFDDYVLVTYAAADGTNGGASDGVTLTATNAQGAAVATKTVSVGLPQVTGVPTSQQLGHNALLPATADNGIPLWWSITRIGNSDIWLNGVEVKAQSTGSVRLTATDGYGNEYGPWLLEVTAALRLPSAAGTASAAWKAYAVGGALVVEGLPQGAEVVVCNLAGVVVARSHEARVEGLPQGLYLVCVNGRGKLVSIRD